MLSNAENRVVLQGETLESSVSGNQEFDSGDHPGVSDEVEESGDVLLKEYKVICGVMLLKNLPNLPEKWQDVRKRSQLREDNLEEAVDGRGDSLAEWGTGCLCIRHNRSRFAPVP